jgi:hypothetical protein
LGATRTSIALLYNIRNTVEPKSLAPADAETDALPCYESQLAGAIALLLALLPLAAEQRFVPSRYPKLRATI